MNLAQFNMYYIDCYGPDIVPYSWSVPLWMCDPTVDSHTYSFQGRDLRTPGRLQTSCLWRRLGKMSMEGTFPLCQKGWAEFFQAETGLVAGICNSMKKHTQLWKCTVHPEKWDSWCTKGKSTQKLSTNPFPSRRSNYINQSLFYNTQHREGGKLGSQWQDCKS